MELYVKSFKSESEYHWAVYVKIHNETIIFYHDNAIAREMGLNTLDYLKMLHDKFNGLFGLFNNEQDAQRALEYINSIIVMRKLTGEYDEFQEFISDIEKLAGASYGNRI